MSHQTGIKANAELVKFFGKLKDSKIRVVKISIENEELTLIEKKEAKKDFKQDYDKMISPLLEPDIPSYILYRLDTKTPLGYGWMLLSWIPDSAKIREKMVYAGTKNTLKNEFGSAHINEELHATTLDETTYDGYLKHKSTFVDAPVPLTSREEEMAELRKTEIKTDFSTESRHQTIGGISCPIHEAALKAIRDMKKEAYNYLQFKIDLDEEKIHIVTAKNIQVYELAAQVPKDHARYHIYLFKHTHESDYLESFVFIYSMPGYNCSVKERMIYSSSKAPFLESLQKLGMEITKKLEIDDADELTEDFLYDEIHPKKMLFRPAFAKPKGPQNRGPKRMVRD